MTAHHTTLPTTVSPRTLTLYVSAQHSTMPTTVFFQNVSAQHWTLPRTDSQNIYWICECPTFNTPNDSVSQNTDCPQMSKQWTWYIDPRMQGSQVQSAGRRPGKQILFREFVQRRGRRWSVLIETANNSTYQLQKTITNSRQQLGLTAASWSRPATN